MNLEILSQRPPNNSAAAPLLFVHGAFLAAWCWAEHFLEFFAGRGHPSFAVSLRGHGGSAGQDRLRDHSMADYTEDALAAAVRVASETGQDPVLIGHSMGAMVVSRALAAIDTPASVLMAPVPPYGLAWPSMEMAWRNPRLFQNVSLIHGGGLADHATTRQVLFSREMPQKNSLAYHRRMQEESGRARLDMMGFDLCAPSRAPGAPLLVQGAAQDVFFPPHMIHATAMMLGADMQVIPRLAHAMMLDVRWRVSAELLSEWLVAQGLGHAVEESR